MRNSIRPLHVFFFGMIFGAGALYLLTDVSLHNDVAISVPQITHLPDPICPRLQTLIPIADARAKNFEEPPTQAPSTIASLLIPVQGVTAEQLVDTFSQARSDARTHEAIDIPSPSGTPVLAVANGTIVKLFISKPGGLTLYQFDSTETFAYYYAHLNGYADGIVEGKQVKRGELIGYVGSTGNANPTAPHLHFAIFELGPKKNWWQGKAINPYPRLGGL
jgi:peptidoglycan LD-endopeptidase LytH